MSSESQLGSINPDQLKIVDGKIQISRVYGFFDDDDTVRYETIADKNDSDFEEKLRKVIQAVYDAGKQDKIIEIKSILKIS
jgi:hypothetical protein